MTTKPQLILKPGREKSLLRRHPWVFSGAIAEVRGDPQPGATVELISAENKFLAQGAYSHQSQIRARVWSWKREDEIDAAFMRERLARAIQARQGLEAESNAYRLVHAESDGLPGLVVDQYGDVLALQCLSWGAEAWREQIADALMDLCAPEAIYERSDVEVRKLEGLPPRSRWVRGELPAAKVQITEHDLNFNVDLAGGHKTGFYLDQRANRLLVRGLAKGRAVLDCFSYTGGFAANALKGEASAVTLVEESGEALTQAKAHMELNQLDGDKCEFIQGDVFQVLRRFRDEGRQFDLAILDPPKFAPTRAQAERAARGYKDINLLALKLLRPGGLLVTFSCSGGIDAALFQKIVAGAALDAGVDARILRRLSQGSDHPVALNFPEGEYLKGLVVEV
ncbi:MAG TPA: class I SAM-dependent methyltransferase [Anaerolineales bacterium]